MSPANATREQRRGLNRANAKQPQVLRPLPDWRDRDDLPPGLIEVWRSRDFLVQVYAERPGMVRASINRTTLSGPKGRWIDGISWDELQRIKREIGRGEQDAVEIYPADKDVVNVANMRHIFIMDAPLDYAWRRS